MGHGLLESQQYINWGKLFYSVCLCNEGQLHKSLETMEVAISDYAKTLDNDMTHPFLENFHQQLGNMSYKMKNT